MALPALTGTASPCFGQPLSPPSPRVPSPCPCQPRQTLSGFAAFNKNSETFGLKSLLYLEEPQRRERPLLRGGSPGSPPPGSAKSPHASARAVPGWLCERGGWGSANTRGQLESRVRTGGGGPAGLPPRPRLRWAVPSAGGARVPVLPGLDGSFCWLRGGGGCVCAAPRRSPRPLEHGARCRPRPAAPRPEAPGSAAMALRRLGAALLLLPLLAAVEGERAAGDGGGERPGTGGPRRPPPPCGPRSLPGGSRRAQVAAGRCVRPRSEARAPRAPGERRALIDCARRRRRDHLAEAL